MIVVLYILLALRFFAPSVFFKRCSVRNYHLKICTGRTQCRNCTGKFVAICCGWYYVKFATNMANIYKLKIYKFAHILEWFWNCGLNKTSQLSTFFSFSSKLLQDGFFWPSPLTLTATLKPIDFQRQLWTSNLWTQIIFWLIVCSWHLS